MLYISLSFEVYVGFLNEKFNITTALHNYVSRYSLIEFNALLKIV